MKALTAHRKQTASSHWLNLLAIAPLWLILSTVVPATGQTSSPTPSPADWTQFLRDNMQRWNPYETVLGPGNVGSFRVKWMFPVWTGTNFLASSPSVANGVVYFGSEDNNVYALNASTGAKLWSFKTGGTVHTSPAVVNGVVYVGSDDDNLYALNASTGVKLWSYAITVGLAGSSSPAVANGVVYYIAGDHVYALNANTGALLWSYGTGSGGPILSSPAVANGMVYFGLPEGFGTVYALNASTGTKLWSYATGSPVYSSPAVANGVVYVTSYENGLFALNASSGELSWNYATAGVVVTSPSVANGAIYIGDNGGTIYAVNASTGTKLWISGVVGGVGSSSPAVANGVVYIDGGETAYALNAITGAQLWSYPVGSFASSPTIVNGMVYILAGDISENGNVYAFGLGTAVEADLFLRVQPTPTTIHQGDLLTYAFPVWNLGPGNAFHEVLNAQVPAGTTFDYVRISGRPGLGTCTTPPYQGTGQIVCHENSSMAPNTTWTVRLTVKVTAPAGTTITESAATMSDTPDPNMANNMATVNVKVQ